MDVSCPSPAILMEAAYSQGRKHSLTRERDFPDNL